MTQPRTGTVESLFADWDRGEFGVFCRKLEIVLARKEHHLAMKLCREFIERQAHDRLTTSSPVVDLLPPQIAGLLESRGYITLESCRMASDRELREIEGMGAAYVSIIRETIESVEKGERPPYADDRSDLVPDWPPPSVEPVIQPPVESKPMVSVKEALQLIIDSGGQAVEELDREIQAKEEELRGLRKMRRMLTAGELEPAPQVHQDESLMIVTKILKANGPMRPSRLAKLAQVDPSSIDRMKASGELMRLPTGSVTLSDAAG